MCLHQCLFVSVLLCSVLPTHLIVGITYTVGISNIIGLLKSEDLDVQIHAVKVVANLAAEGITDIQFLSQLYSYASDQFYVYDPNCCFAYLDFS